MASVLATSQLQELHYVSVALSGVQCLELINDGSKDPEKSKQRRKEKDMLGQDHTEIPFLDCKTGDNGKKDYNDAIVYTDRVKLWDENIVRYYESKGFHVDSRDLPGGIQRSIKDDSTQFVSITFYNNTGKFMVQPGSMQGQNIVNWLADFVLIKHILDTPKLPVETSTSPATTGKEGDRSKENSPDAPSQPIDSQTGTPLDNEVKPTKHPKGKRTKLKATGMTKSKNKQPTRRSHRLNSVPFSFQKEVADYEQQTQPSMKRAASSKPFVAAPKKQKLNVTTHQDHLDADVQHDIEDGYINLMIPCPPLPLGAKFHQRKFVVNNLLCYLQNKVDSSPFNVIVKITSDFYATEEIKEAKELLFKLITIPNFRKRRCIGPNKDRDDVSDMLKMLLCADLSDMPIFLALDINRLPPINGDSLDMSSILHKIEGMQTSIDLLSGSQNDLTDLVNSQMRNPTPPCDGEQSDSPLDDYSQTETLEDEPNPSKRTYRDALQQEKPVPATNQTYADAPVDSLVSGGMDRPDHVPVISRVITNSMYYNTSSNSQSGYQKKGRFSHGTEKRNNQMPQHSSQRDLVIGRGSAPGLQAARRQQGRPSQPNRVCSGVFVTNLSANTSALQVERYLKRETSYNVQVEKLDTRYNTYSSFYIRCKDPLRRQLLCPDVWPQDVKAKLYFS